MGILHRYVLRFTFHAAFVPVFMPVIVLQKGSMCGGGVV